MFTRRQLVQISASSCVLGLFLTLGAQGALAAQAQAQGKSRDDCAEQFNPQSGQPGKDVVWVPTNDALVTRMLQMADVTAADQVYDLGAGDGKIAIAAAKEFGAQAVGVEYNPEMAKLAQCFAEAEGVANRVRIVQGDIFETDFSSADVVTLYLLPELNLRLRPTLLKMKPGTRVVSHSFLMDDWEPDERSMTDDGSAYLWIVPANVAGKWRFREQGGKDNFVVQFDQTFQEIEASAGDRNQSIEGAEVKGTNINFALEGKGGPARVAGTVNGKRIDAKVTRGARSANYVGTRI